AGSQEYKTYWKTKLEGVKERSLKIANRVKTDRILSEQERTYFYSSPIYSAVHLYTSVGGKGKNLGEICERLDLSRARAAEILRFLVETGLCIEQNGQYSMGNQKTHLEQGSPHLARHLTNWRIRAIQQSEELTPQEILYSAQVSLARKDFDLLREKMVEFI